MTTYKLPEWLGGGTYEAVGIHHDDHGESMIRLDIPGVGTRRLPSDLLTEVKPPLPPEPEDGYVGRAGRFVWERDDRAEQQGEAGPGKHWWRPGDDRTYTWEAVHEINTNAGADLVRLVADPADDAPELPWTLDSCRRRASVGTPKHGTVVVDVPGVDYTPGECEQIARALLSAARAVREVEQP